jgi:AcrR family transcriptional regulator
VPRRFVGRPAAISRADVLAAGLEIGMDGLTVAAVAERLGVTRTSVHRHVGSRAELETLVGEHLVVAAPVPVDRGQPLVDYLLEFARLLSRHMLAHPGLAAYYNRGFPRTAAAARVVEDFDATLVARGLSHCQAVRAAVSTANLAIGLAAFRQLGDETPSASLDPEAFPILTGLHEVDAGEWFDWALRSAVRGIADHAGDPC